MALFGPKLSPDLIALVAGARVLASTQTTDGTLVGLAERLLYPGVNGPREVEWHQIERGSWNAQTQHLSWTTVDAEPVDVELVKPGRFPQFFRERVNATIAYTGSLGLGGKKSVVINARRSLAEPNAPLIWRASPGADTTAADIADDPLVALELERRRAEFDLR